MNWKQILGQIAPSLATAFGVPPMVTGALAWVGEKVLGKPAGTPATLDEVQQVIEQGDPATLLKLKQADIDYNQHLADLGVQLQALDVQDRGNARALAMAKGFLPQIALTILFISGYFIIFGLVTAGTIRVPADFHDVFEQAFGAMLATVTMICNFWFGSTHSSQKKDAAIVDAAVGP